jgi:Popeye protein conserved region
MNSLKPNLLFHTANALLLLGYSVSDVLWLRLLGAVSALISIPYFAMQPAPMWLPIGWNAAFVTVNLFHSWRLVLRRRALKVAPSRQSQPARTPQSYAPAASIYAAKTVPQ